MDPCEGRKRCSAGCAMPAARAHAVSVACLLQGEQQLLDTESSGIFRHAVNRISVAQYVYGKSLSSSVRVVDGVLPGLVASTRFTSSYAR